MAFSFGNAANALNSGASSGLASGSMAAPGATGAATQGPDLELIQTEGLGFLSLAGDAKVQLTSRWADPPAATASLISIASRKGLVAAAGPDAVHVATTESVRKAFQAPKNGDSEVRPFEPQAKLALPMRISQLSFTADERFLIISAETGGGLAIYDVQSVTQGSTQPAIEISTSGEALRVLLPNPNPEMAELVLAVTVNGNLLVANLKQRGLVSGPSGPVLKAGVSSAAWSTKGKQIVAGLADGTLEQLTPDGVTKAQIPKPAGLDNHHVASVAWLENNVFLVIHNITNGDDPTSTYHVITRHQEKGSPPSFVFQKLTDPVEPYGSEKKPHHTVLRLKDFPPNLQDLLLVSSSCREAIGLLTRSTAPLTNSVPADKITNVFTTTEFADDSKRAQLPMGEDYMDTFPIGTAIDLSSKDKVYKPIPAEEMDESPGPLPGLWALNNEGVVAIWWIVYNDSIRNGTTYPGISAAEAAPAPTIAAPTSAMTAFGGASSSPAPAFGGTSALGSKPSPWASSSSATASAAPAFGVGSAFGSGGADSSNKTPAALSFGTPATLGSGPAAPAFGQSSVIGGGMASKTSPWAAAGTSSASQAFGQPSFGSSGAGGAGKVFGSGASSGQASGGGFSAFANKGGFGSLAASGGTDDKSGGSIFASGKSSGTFGFGTGGTGVAQDTAFPPPGAKTDSNASPFNASSFVLGTTFQADPKTANDNEKPSASGGSLFGSGFGLSLGDSTKTPAAAETKDADMDTGTPAAEKQPSLFGSKSGSSMFGAPTVSGAQSDKPNPFANPPANKPNPFAAAGGDKPGLFGSTATTIATTTQTPAPTSIFEATKKPDEPAKSIFAKQDSTPQGEKKNPFGSFGASTTPTSSPAPTSIFGGTSSGGSGSIFGAPTKISSSNFSFDKKTDGDSKSENTTNPPLPPESTKSILISKPSAVVDDAPLPPDPVREKSKYTMPDLKLPQGTGPGDRSSSPAPPNSKPAASLPKFSFQNDETPEKPVPESDEGSEVSEEEEEEGEEAGEVSPLSGEEDDDDEQVSAVDSEGSGVDVAKDLSPPGYTPQSSFGGAGGGLLSHTPVDDPRPGSRLLFGEMSRNGPIFPRPVATSPRSPSPVRGSIPPRVLRSDSVRSVSAPGMASSILGRKTTNFGLSGTARQNLGRHTPDVNVEEQRKSQARREADESQSLNDEEDDWKQELINAPPQPTLELAEFMPNIGSAPEAGRTVPAQAEAIYRDINRMVDTLGLNARHLKEYILGHMGKLREPGAARKTKEDLEFPDDWILCDAEDMGPILEQELRADLDRGRIRDVDEVLEGCQELSKGLARLRVKEMDIKKTIMSRVDPSQMEALKSLPLSAEQAAQQADLRKQFTNFAKLLAEAEESLTMLRAKMATASSAVDGRKSGSLGGAASGPAAVPTVDAVLRTVMKMTSMAEKRSGDVDVLENQLRRLRLQQQGPGAANGSREGSPFATPQKQQNRLSRSIFSPGASRASAALNASVGGAASPARSVGGGTPRKKLSGYSDDEKRRIRAPLDKRAAAIARLRDGVEKAGPNVWRLTNDD